MRFKLCLKYVTISFSDMQLPTGPKIAKPFVYMFCSSDLLQSEEIDFAWL